MQTVVVITSSWWDERGDGERESAVKRESAMNEMRRHRQAKEADKMGFEPNQRQPMTLASRDLAQIFHRSLINRGPQEPRLGPFSHQ